MSARIPPSLAGRTVRPGDAADAARPERMAGTTSRPARRKRRVPAITRSSAENFLRKIFFSVVVSVIASAISGAATYIVDMIWRLF